MLANVLHRLGTTTECLGDLSIRPRRTIGIRLQQNLRPSNLLTTSFQFPDNAAKHFPFLICQTNHILLLHQSLLALERPLIDYPNLLA